MKILKVLIIALLAIVVLLFLGSFILSPQFEIVRSERINAPQARVVYNLADFSAWPKWWPWNQRGGELTVSGSALEVGSTLAWSKRPSPGRLVITQSNIYAVDFDAFLEGNNFPLKGTLAIKPEGDATLVTWRVAGRFETWLLAPYLASAADSMHGGMLAWGLRNLKQMVESDNRSLEIFYDDEAGRPVSVPVR